MQKEAIIELPSSYNGLRTLHAFYGQNIAQKKKTHLLCVALRLLVFLEIEKSIKPMLLTL